MLRYILDAKPGLIHTYVHTSRLVGCVGMRILQSKGEDDYEGEGDWSVVIGDRDAGATLFVHLIVPFFILPFHFRYSIPLHRSPFR